MAKKKSTHRTPAKKETGAKKRGDKSSRSTEKSGQATDKPTKAAKAKKRASNKTPQRPKKKTGSTDESNFLVVGIGASAGGLEALQDLVEQLPADTGMAQIVVTHQHPGHTSLLPELLGRKTKVSVAEAADATKIEPNHVYVAPPGEYLALQGGTLQLTQFEMQHAPPLPIDYFFRSLADDQHERAVCIVLSGTGTDGTIGLKAVKAESGMAMVQQPQTAKYAGMPSSAIGTGLADYVLPPAEMPQQLVAYAQGPYLQGAAAAAQAPAVSTEAMQKVLLRLRARTGHDFLGYKPTTIRRRIERRMNVHQIEQPQQYVHYLEENPHEIDLLFKELLISVTSFFRDKEAWDALGEGPLPELLLSRPENYTLRAWVPGCATGEEAYSLAILLRECMDHVQRPLDVQIFGTDLDGAAIEIARAARYPDGIAADVLPPRLERYLVREDGTFRVRQEIREMAMFALQNAIKDPPFTKLDLLCCRNLLIYLDSELQKRLLPIFHYALKPGGILFLGPSETTGGFTDLFEPIDKKWKIYRRRETAAAAHPPEMPASLPPSEVEAIADDISRSAEGTTAHPSAAAPPRAERLIERLMLARFCPASVVVNERGDIVHVHGRTGFYLEPAEGQPTMNVLEMAREGLQIELASAIRQAAADGKEVSRRNVRVKSNGEYSHIDLSVLRIADPEPIRGLLMVTFRPVPVPPETPPPKKAGRPAKHDTDRVEQLEREVQYLTETHQSTLEELGTANEELKSTNEELQSTNEELQSSNEELETSKEEMQSLNEELTTVNTELQSKVDELSNTNDDMQNLLNSIDVATLFLDNELNIKRFTEPAKELIKLRQTDVGRPIDELATKLNHDALSGDCREVLKTLMPKQREVVRTDGTWYMMRVLPYRTTRNVIDGLVITFVNIDELKQAKLAGARRAYFENLFETVRHPLVVLDEQLCVESVNRAFCQTFRLRPKKVEGTLIYEVGDNDWDIPELRELLEEVLPKRTTFDNFEVDHEFRRLGRKVFSLNACCVEQTTDLPGMILLGLEDVTDKYGG